MGSDTQNNGMRREGCLEAIKGTCRTQCVALGFSAIFLGTLTGSSELERPRANTQKSVPFRILELQWRKLGCKYAHSGNKPTKMKSIEREKTDYRVMATRTRNEQRKFALGKKRRPTLPDSA